MRCILKKTIISLLLVLFINSYADEHVPDVTVRTKRISFTQHYALTPVQSISQQQIKNSGATTLTNVLQAQSSIQLHRLYSNGDHSTLSLRGFGDNANMNILILIDGMPVTNPDLGPTIIDMMPLEDIQEINILSGSAGVLYGDQAVGGVINIITKQHRKAHYRISTTHGSDALANYQVSISQRWHNGLSFNLGAKRKQGRGYRKHNKEQQDNLQGGVGYHYPTGSVLLKYHYINDQLEYPGALTAEQVMSDRRQSQNNTDFNNETHHNILLEWRQEMNNNWSLQQGILLETMHGEGTLTSPFTENRNLLIINPRISGAFDLQHLTIENQSGLLFQNAKYQINGAGFASQSTQKKWALFSQFVVPIMHHVKATIGARAAQSQVSLRNNTQPNHAKNQATATEFGIDWALKNHMHLYARRAGSYRLPKAEENALTQNNAPLNTQHGISYETGLLWKNHNKKLSINLFCLNLDDEILFVPNQAGLLGANENLPPTQRLGGDIHFDYPISHRWKMRLGYSYVDARFHSGPEQGNLIPFVASNKISLQSDFRFNQHTHLIVEGLFIGSRYPASDVSNQGDILPGFALFNVSVQYQFRHITLTAAIKNLTNHKYSYYAQVNHTAQGLQTYYYPAPGHNFWISVSFDL